MSEYSTACLDWEERIVSRKSLVPKPIFPGYAAEAMEIFNSLIIVDVVGQPRMGEVSRPWLQEFARSIFGCYDESSGKRLIRDFFLLISKKNTKSTTAAGIMLTVLIMNWRSSAEFLILAPTKEVADNSFFPARDSIRADPELESLLQIQDHIRTITHRETRATLKIVAADSESASGKKATGVLVDELWLFGSKHNADAMLREATGGLASRPEGFVIYLSTQSDKPPAGVFKSKLQYARGVRDGRIKDNQFLPVLYEFPKKYIDTDKYKDPKYWYITNPNLGLSVDEEFLLREYKKAEEDGKEELNVHLAKHLNVEIGMRLAADNWPGAEYWKSCESEEVTFDELLSRSEVITFGIDGGGLDDLLGIAAVGRLIDDNRELTQKTWWAWTHAWAHKSVLERRKQIAPILLKCENDGYLTIVDRVGEDISGVLKKIVEIEKSGLLNAIGIDQIGVPGILDAIEGAGIDKEIVFGVRQGWALAGAIKTTERRLASRDLLHHGGGLMEWCVANAKVEARANSTLVTKKVSGSAKIDPLMALFNAVELMALNPKSMKEKFQFMVF